MLQYSSLWKETSVSWAHTDGARSGVVDEEVVSNVTGAPGYQTTHFNESTRRGEMVSKTRLSPSVQFLLLNLHPILEPSSLLGFLKNAGIRETEHDFLTFYFFSQIALREGIDGFCICL